jgi:hypothetical protein
VGWGGGGNASEVKEGEDLTAVVLDQRDSLDLVRGEEGDDWTISAHSKLWGVF